jgi:hypothetical protein
MSIQQASFLESFLFRTSNTYDEINTYTAGYSLKPAGFKTLMEKVLG